MLVFTSTLVLPTPIFDFIDKEESRFVLLQLRLPKMLTATLVGASLAVCGFLLQQLFKNELADPYILGISSGASLAVGVLLVFIPFLRMEWLQSISLALGGAIGSGGVLFLMILIARKFGHNYILLLAGVMIGQVAGAMQGLINVLANPTDLKMYSLWSMGSFGKTYDIQLFILALITICGLLFAYKLLPALKIMLLGGEVAQTMGVNPNKLSFQILVCSGVLAGVCTAFCGPIAFLGMAVPNLVRMVFKTSNYKQLFFGNIVIGASMALLCESVANLPFFEIYLPINVMSALIGGPITLYILLKNNVFTRN